MILSLVAKKPTSFDTDGLIAIVVGFIKQLLCQQGVLARSRHNSFLALVRLGVFCLIGVWFELNFVYLTTLVSK